MEERIKIPLMYTAGALVLVIIGIVAFVAAFTGDAGRGWANLLLNNYYFVSLAVGAVVFLAIQRVTQSGWSAGFIRVPEAMGAFLPVAAILFLALIPGVHSLYHWSHTEALAHDPLLAHKSPFLNVPFWIVRMVIYFALWIFLFRLLRRYSLKEDREGGLENFRKLEHYAKIFIFVILITFSIAGIDWIMSIDAHWYSTLFAAKNFVSAFYHGAAVIAFIVLLMNQGGYFPFLKKSHLHDFSSYIFMLCIIWGYFWFAEFMLIWYGNIPEETAYFIPRAQGEGWPVFFYANILVNWFIPFVIMMPKASRQSKTTLKIIIPVLLVGQFIDLYLQIFPGAYGKQVLGFPEIGAFLGFAGLFMLVVGYALSRANLYPVNHPYMEECQAHHL